MVAATNKKVKKKPAALLQRVWVSNRQLDKASV